MNTIIHKHYMSFFPVPNAQRQNWHIAADAVYSDDNG